MPVLQPLLTSIGAAALELAASRGQASGVSDEATLFVLRARSNHTTSRRSTAEDVNDYRSVG